MSENDNVFVLVQSHFSEGRVHESVRGVFESEESAEEFRQSELLEPQHARVEPHGLRE